MFMVGMVFAVLFGLGGLVWSSWRTAKRREIEHGEVFAPQGKLRWNDADPPR
jgi:hypothetical protein